MWRIKCLVCHDLTRPEVCHEVRHDCSLLPRRAGRNHMKDWLSDSEVEKFERRAWVVELEATILGSMMLFLALSYLLD